MSRCWAFLIAIFHADKEKTWGRNNNNWDISQGCQFSSRLFICEVARKVRVKSENCMSNRLQIFSCLRSRSDKIFVTIPTLLWISLWEKQFFSVCLDGTNRNKTAHSWPKELNFYFILKVAWYRERLHGKKNMRTQASKSRAWEPLTYGCRYWVSYCVQAVAPLWSSGGCPRLV